MSKCKGCPFWKWVRKDTLYESRGYHYCEKNELTTCRRRNGEMTRAEQRALEAYPRDDDKELNFRRANYRIAYERGYNQALKDIGIVNEMIDQKGVAIVDTIDNYSGHQTINTIRFVGEDDDKPKPLPCKYYHVWLKAAKEEEL